MNRRCRTFALVALPLLCALVLPTTVLAHCDSMDGPVVKAARAALEKGDVDRVLIWVKPGDEPAIREAFQHTLAVRKLGPEARDLADRWFFETLVRLHRAGEGAPFTGLKPAGQDFGPAIPAADRAIETGDPGPLSSLLIEAVRKSLHERYRAVMAARRFAPGDVAAGREYVECYVAFIHQGEAIWRAATQAPGGHLEDSAAAEPPPGHGDR